MAEPDRNRKPIGKLSDKALEHQIEQAKKKIGAANAANRHLDNLDVPLSARDELHALGVAVDDNEEKCRERLNKLRKAKRLRNQADHKGEDPKNCYANAQKYAGMTEDPYGSNLGPPKGDLMGITQMEQKLGYTPPPGVYWCGCFAGSMITTYGHAEIPVLGRFGYGPSLIADAHAGANGVYQQDPTKAHLMSVLVYWGGEHIGLLIEYLGNGLFKTIEGNTSSADGSQSNGGGIFVKQRSLSDITACAGWA